MTSLPATQIDLDGRPDHLPSLDGLRGIAVLLVLLGHANLEPLDLGFKSAGFGVSIFFVLSGFLITRILLASKSQSKTLRKFWTKRVARLLPPFAIFFVAQWLLKGWHTQDLPWILTYTYNWQRIIEGGIAEDLGYGHLWSLAIEEQFYLIWPLLLLWVPRRWGVILTGAFIAASVVQTLRIPVVYPPDEIGTRIYFGTDTHAVSLLSGALIAQVEPWARRGTKLTFIGLGLFILAALVTRLDDMPSMKEHLSKSITAVGVICIAIRCQHPAIKGLLCDARLRWVGRISYGLYIYHVLWFRPDPTAWYWWCVAWVVTFFVAYVSYHYLELPIMRWARRLITKPAKPTDTPTPAQ